MSHSRQSLPSMVKSASNDKIVHKILVSWTWKTMIKGEKTTVTAQISLMLRAVLAS